MNLTLTGSQQSRVRGLPSGWPDLVTSHEPVRIGGRVNLVRDERVLTLHPATWRAMHASEVLGLHRGPVSVQDARGPLREPAPLCADVLHHWGHVVRAAGRQVMGVQPVQQG